jgi:hypothetical protein
MKKKNVCSLGLIAFFCQVFYLPATNGTPLATNLHMQSKELTTLVKKFIILIEMIS